MRSRDEAMSFLPRRLAAVLLTQADLAAESKAGELSKAGRAALVQALKRLAKVGSI